MSQLIPSPQDCCSPCPAPVVTTIPGTPGATGADGADGADGIDAFTITTADFTMPAELGNVLVNVAMSDWATVGQIVYVSNGAAEGYFEVVSKPDSTSVTLKNLEDTANNAYVDNSAPGIVFATGAQISPGGLQGPVGNNGTSGAPDDATYVVQTHDAALTNAYELDLQNTGLLHVTMGVGADGTIPVGIADDDMVQVDRVGGLTPLDMIRATANGIETRTAAEVGTDLGLGGMAYQDPANVNITGGTITGVAVPAATGLVGDYLLFQHTEISGNSGGDFLASGSWINVPINTEISDSGGHGTVGVNPDYYITLNPGTYRVRAGVLGNAVGSFQGRLYNFDTGLTDIWGTCEVTDTVGSHTGHSFVLGKITVPGPGTQRLQLQGKCLTSNPGDGFGLALTLGGPEVYSFIEFEKET